MTVEEIRSAVSVLPRLTSGKLSRVPPALRSEILNLAKSSSVESAGKAVGISPLTINHWRGPRGKTHSKGRFRQVTITEKAEPVFTVEGPAGLRIHGSVSDIARLLREVSA